MVGGILLLVLALLFYYLAVLRVDLKHTSFLDLGPYPDAVEYFAQAKSMLHHAGPKIQIGYDVLPSRYPPGYPILMIPWLSCLPHHGIYAPFRTNQTIGLLLIIGCFALYYGSALPLAGGIAALLLATQPALVTYSRASMSDLSGAAVAVLAFALAYLGLKFQRRWLLYATAVVLGLSLCIRPQLVFLAPLLISMAFYPQSNSIGRWFFHCVLILVIFAVAASPYFLFNWAEFGHPLKTGYDFWVPSLTDHQMPFSLRNLPRQAAMLWSEATATRTQFQVANLFGTGTYFVPAFVLLSLVGLGFCRFNRFTGSAFLAGASFFLATATYSFVDGRFFMPLQFLFVSVATLPVVWALSEWKSKRRHLWRVPILLLFVLCCLGYPSQSGYTPRNNRAQVWDAIHLVGARGSSPRYKAVTNFSRAFARQPGIVLSNIDPVYLNALLPPLFVAAPIDGMHSYAYSRAWHYGELQAIQLIRRGLAQHLPVYSLRVPPMNPKKGSGPLPAVEGHTWRPETVSRPGFLVMSLISDR
ncbi:MAG: hypothetical protein ABI233_10840 [Chthoniobacterales bacterium]